MNQVILALNPGEKPVRVCSIDEYFRARATYFVVLDRAKEAIVYVIKGSERGIRSGLPTTTCFPGLPTTTCFPGLPTTTCFPGSNFITVGSVVAAAGLVVAIITAFAAVIKAVTLLLRSLTDLIKAVKELGKEFEPYYKQACNWAKENGWN